VLRESGVMQLYGICEADIGNVYLQWGSYAIAISYFQRALKIAEEIGDGVSQRKWSHNLALAYGKLGDDANRQSFAAWWAPLSRYLRR
jgi:tetratricopeptide (TPR) repeat protein